MADAAEQLKLLLSINDRMSKGLNQPIASLRRLAKEGGSALAVLQALQRQMGRPVQARAYVGLSKELRAVRSDAQRAEEALEKIRRISNRRSPGSSTNPATAPIGQGGGTESSLIDSAIAAGAGYKVAQFYKSGVTAAGDYEAALLQLRNAFAEYNIETGKVNEGALAQQLADADLQTKQLGNDLVGTTQDYVEIFAALRKGGLETRDILDGAGKAAAELAAISGAVTEGRGAAQAKELAMFFKMFHLQKADFDPMVNLFSGLQDKFGIDSDSIIEAGKLYGATANTLGQSGLKGAQESAKLFAFMKQYAGLEGSIAGGTAQALFTRFSTRGDKAVQELQKSTGIQLQLFDKQGKYVGYEQTFRELEKLRKLNPEQLLQTLYKVFGEEGGRVAGAMVTNGVEGWEKIGSEAAKAVPYHEKLNAQMKTYNAKVEAAGGSWANLKATAFSGLAESAKPVLDVSNDLLGTLQDLSKAHPTIVKTTLLIAAMGTAVVVTSKAINGLRLVSAALNSIQAGGAGAAGSLNKIGAVRMVGTTAALAGIAYGIYSIIEAYEKFKEVSAQQSDNSVGRYQDLQKKEAAAKAAGKTVPASEYASVASTVLAQMSTDDLRGQLNNQSSGAWRMRQLIPGANPWNSWPWSGFDPHTAATHIGQTSRELSDPGVMASAISQVNKQIPDSGQRYALLEAFRQAFPDSFKAATQQLAQEQLKAADATKQTTTNLTAANQPLLQFPANLNLANMAAQDFATRMRNVQLAAPATVTPGAPGSFSLPGNPLVPKSAIGSVVYRDGLVHAHRGNVITPAGLSRKSPGDWLKNIGPRREVASAGHTHFHFHFNIAPGANVDRSMIKSAVNDAIAEVDIDDLARRMGNAVGRNDERS
jgi:TP901 family phage tail tape measure protein